MASPDTRYGVRSSAWRFLVAGGTNTLITAAMLAGLSLIIDPRVAYTIVFMAGVAVSTILADRFVYGVRMDRRSIIAYVALYLVVYLIGLAVVAALHATALPTYASALVVVVTAPMTFLGGRVITGRLHRTRQENAA